MEWIEIGKLAKTHGLKGEIKFIPYFEEEDVRQNIRLAVLDPDPDPEKPQDQLQVEAWRGSGKRMILKLKGCDSIESAQLLSGKTLYARAEDFAPLPENEYYRFQIIGLKVYDEHEKFYGRVEEIIETGSNDVYVVRNGDFELLLPMIDSVVQSIDLDQGKLIFRVVEGLLENASV